LGADTPEHFFYKSTVFAKKPLFLRVFESNGTTMVLQLNNLTEKPYVFHTILVNSPK